MIGSGLIDFEGEDDSGWCRLDMKLQQQKTDLFTNCTMHITTTLAGLAQQHEQKQRKNQGCDKDGDISAYFD